MSNRHLCPPDLLPEYDEYVANCLSVGIPVSASELLFALTLLLGTSVTASGRIPAGERRGLLAAMGFGDAVLHGYTGHSVLDDARSLASTGAPTGVEARRLH